MSTPHTQESATQIAVNEIDTATMPIEVKRGLGARVREFVTLDRGAAGVIGAREAQLAERLSHGEIGRGIQTTEAMWERASALNEMPEQHHRL